MKLVMFRRVKPRGFNYKPIHYDPVKEAREERRKELLGADYRPMGEGDTSTEEYQPGQYIRSGGLRHARIGHRTRQDEKRRASTVRALIALGILALLAVWYFTSK